MGVCKEIEKARCFGEVHCGLSTLSNPSLPQLAHEFGLDDNSAWYQEIDEVAARRLASLVLHQDLAYKCQIMTVEDALRLGNAFIDQFSGAGTRYFTNGGFHEPGPSGWNEWNPVTAATFDTGVLAIGEKTAGCLWVEDED